MHTYNLLDDLEFSDRNVQGTPVHVDDLNRIIRFSFSAGQSMKEHSAPSSPVNLVVIRGTGWFSGGDGDEQEVGPRSLVHFERGEQHSIRAGEEELVVLAILHGSPMGKA